MFKWYNAGSSGDLYSKVDANDILEDEEGINENDIINVKCVWIAWCPGKRWKHIPALNAAKNFVKHCGKCENILEVKVNL